MSTDALFTAPVLLFDRSTRLRMRFTGAKAGEALTGLVTNDVLALRGGDGLYACALTPKGRIIADVRIFAMPALEGTAVDTYEVDANAAGGPGFAAMIRKYVNPRLAKYSDVSAAQACLTLSGPGALALVRALGAGTAAVDALAAAAPFTHRTLALAGTSVRVARVPDLGARDTVDLVCDADAGATLADAAVAAGAVRGDDATWHRLRVLAGRPEWGMDMDEGTLAQEANMDALDAISYRKGCYTGQETVARVHFRGHVNRTLRRVQYGDLTAPGHDTELRDASDAVVGAARSTAVDDAGVLVGLAMIRREVTEGTPLLWRDADGAVHALHVSDAVSGA